MKKVLLFIIFLIAFVKAQSPPQTEYFLEGTKVYDIVGESKYTWIATYGNGIYRYSNEDGSFVNYSSHNGSLENDFFYCITVSKDYVWAGSSEGLFIYNKKKDQWTKKRFSQGGEWGNWIRALAYDRQLNALWIGRFRNLTYLDINSGKYTDYDKTQNNDTKTNNFITIKIDADSLVWFGTESGLHKYDKSKGITDPSAWTYLNNKNGGFNGDGEAVSLTDIAFEGRNIWFSTDEFVTPEKPMFNVGGIYRFNRKSKWDRISKANGLPVNGVYSIERTGNYFWASVYQFNKNDKKEFGKSLVLINRFTGRVDNLDINATNITTSTFYTLYFDGKFMWLGTNIGLYKVSLSNELAKWTLKKEEAKAESKPKPKPKKKKK